MNRILSIVLSTIFLSSCAPITQSTRPEQSLDKPLMVGIGDVVLHIEKKENLKNAFGKSDIFGRKSNVGFSELRFAGVEKTGEVVLYRKDVRIVSNETTMSRTPIAITSGQSNSTVSGGYYGTPNSGMGTANVSGTYSATTLSSPSDYHVAIPSDTFPIRLAVGETKLPIEGYIVEILNARPNSLEYRITKY